MIRMNTRKAGSRQKKYLLERGAEVVTHRENPIATAAKQRLTIHGVERVDGE